MERIKVFEALATVQKATIHLRDGSYVKGIKKRLSGTNVTLVGIKDGKMGMWAEKLASITFVSDEETEEILYS